jgi:2-polyprenyl-3-methyl-5-hydroxy-6-metoxy-1,4-benzoquinol methylase
MSESAALEAVADGADYSRPVASNIPKEAVPECPVCESPRQHTRYLVKEHEYDNTTDDQFPLVECDDCGAWFLNPRPAASALDVIYPPNYFTNVLESRAGGDIDKAKSGLFSVLTTILFKQRARPITKYMELTPQTRWLDVGCGTGASLEAMREAYGMSGKGFDYSEKAAALTRARGFEAQSCRFEDYDPGGERFDLVHSSHVIEHLESPLRYMRKCYEILEPGGLSVFFTPNIDTWEARRFGRHWGGLHVPRHWALLSPASSRTMAELAGFEFLEASFSTNGMFWTWSFHSALQERFGRRAWNDTLLPSDHRFIESNLLNLARFGAFLFLDIFNLLTQGRSANMLVVCRKPRDAPN